MSVFSAGSQTRFQGVLDSPRVVPCHPFCLWSSWIEYQGAAGGGECPVWGPLNPSMQIMWLCWLHQTVTLRTRFGMVCSWVWGGWVESQTMVLYRKTLDCSLQVGSVCPNWRRWSAVKMERHVDRQIGAASAVMQGLYRTIVVFSSQSTFEPLTYSNAFEEWPKRWNFLCRVAGLTLGEGAELRHQRDASWATQFWRITRHVQLVGHSTIYSTTSNLNK